MSESEQQQTTDPMQAWWQSSLGQCILQQEKDLFQRVSIHFHGYYQLQVGVEEKLLPDMTMPKFRRYMGSSADVQGSHEALPFKSNSLDTLVLAHVLEFSDDPHQVLREAERVLVSDGTMIICCFNPWSLWGLRRLLPCKSAMPWQGHFFGKSRIKDWLALLNFEVAACERLMFRPPLKTEKWLNRTRCLETAGQRFWPALSGLKVLVATKRTIPLTPATQRWRTRQLFPNKGLVTKPATREKTHGSS